MATGTTSRVVLPPSTAVLIVAPSLCSNSLQIGHRKSTYVVTVLVLDSPKTIAPDEVMWDDVGVAPVSFGWLFITTTRTVTTARTATTAMLTQIANQFVLRAVVAMYVFLRFRAGCVSIFHEISMSIP